MSAKPPSMLDKSVLSDLGRAVMRAAFLDNLPARKPPASGYLYLGGVRADLMVTPAEAHHLAKTGFRDRTTVEVKGLDGTLIYSSAAHS